MHGQKSNLIVATHAMKYMILGLQFRIYPT